MLKNSEKAASSYKAWKLGNKIGDYSIKKNRPYISAFNDIEMKAGMRKGFRMSIDGSISSTRS